MISSYNDARGNHVSRDVTLDENHFPVKYTVYVRSADYPNDSHTKTFPGTKKGAAEARTYFESYKSIFTMSCLRHEEAAKQAAVMA